MDAVHALTQDGMYLLRSPLVTPLMLACLYSISTDTGLRRLKDIWIQAIVGASVGFSLLYLLEYYQRHLFGNAIAFSWTGQLPDDIKYNVAVYFFLGSLALRTNVSIRSPLYALVGSIFLLTWGNYVAAATKAMRGLAWNATNARDDEFGLAVAMLAWLGWTAVIDRVARWIRRIPQIGGAEVMNVVITIVIVGFAFSGFLLMEKWQAFLFLLFWIIAYPVALAFTMNRQQFSINSLVDLYNAGLTQVPILGKIFRSQMSFPVNKAAQTENIDSEAQKSPSGSETQPDHRESNVP
jgi:hypothetical protein